MLTRKYKSGLWMAWSLFALSLIVVPLIFDQSAAHSLLAQMGIMMIFGLSYNMLLGQGGMLSFGHAVYSGLGAFCAVHAMNLAGNGDLWIPVALVPLVGGLAGMLFGILFGYVTTRKAGTTFAMITLGIGELVFVGSLMFPGFFGGEGGVSTNRVIGEPVLGISYASQIQVYYLIAFWLFVSTAGMYAFTQTPLGRIINAVRDNPERVEHIGYDPRWVRYLTLILSGFFAGISGALSAINFEIVSAENLGVARSAAVLLFTFVGGIGYFCGPMIGAVIGVLLNMVLSDLTRAWQLYLGLFFIGIVMVAPGGVAGVIMDTLRLLRLPTRRRIWLPMGAVCLSAMLALGGLVMAIELTYRLDSMDGVTSASFAFAAALFVGGACALHRSGRALRQACDEADR